jgi:hypothetical protein
MAGTSRTKGSAGWIAASLAALLVLGGCTSFGAQAIQTNRKPYNIAIQSTNDEQMLLNLARLKYRDTPFFLQVSSVATQFVFNPAAEVSGQLNEGGPGVLGLNAGISYEENPTVTYAPLQGNEFVERMLSPISLDTVLLLYHSGWSIERVLRVCVQRMNDVKNAPTASGPTPATAPEYEDFRALASAFRVLQKRDALVMGYEQQDERTVLVMRIAPEALAWPETRLIARTLGLAEGEARFVVTPSRWAGGDDRIGIETRSLMGVLFYLSQGVEVPPADEERGVVTVTRYEDGTVFDWSKVTGNLLTVRTQATRPSQASVAVQYRGQWFYIDDADLPSKSTFALLDQLFALQAGEIEKVQPLFTLPLSR